MMKISEVSRRTGASAHALRHYERLGMIRPARRPSGYRDYDERAVRDVAFIVAGRRLGFALRTLAEALPAWRGGRLTPAQGIEALGELVADLERQIAALQAQRRHLRAHMARLKKEQPQPARAGWPSVKRSRR